VGRTVVDLIVTNLGVLEVVPGGLKILELAHGVSDAELCAATEAVLVGSRGRSRGGAASERRFA
jgi:3-oxoacid CoA-transferase subunit B